MRTRAGSAHLLVDWSRRGGWGPLGSVWRHAMSSLCTVGIVHVAATILVFAGGAESRVAAAGTVGRGAVAWAAGQPAAKPIKNKSQLIGSWYTDGVGDTLGLEFSEDGKVVVTLVDPLNDSAIGASIVIDYAVMEGGRVRLTMLGGMSEVITCGFDDKGMSFVPRDQVLLHCTHFVRIKGMSVEDAHKAKMAEAGKKAEAAGAGVRALLGKPNLALVSVDPRGRMDRFALELKGGPDVWTGVGYVEGNVVIARQVQVSLQPPATVSVAFGPVVGPPGMGQMQPETFTLAAKGSGDKLDVTDGTRALRSDAGAFKDLVERYKKVAAEREAAIGTFAEPFGAYARLDGELRYPGNPNAPARKMTLGLIRMEGKPAFLVADLSVDANPGPAAFNKPAVIELAEGGAVLNMGNSQVLKAATDNGKTVLRGQMMGSEATLRIAESLTKEEVIKRRAAVAEFLDKTMQGGVTLSGRITEDDRDISAIHPLHFELKSDGQRNLSGAYFADSVGAKCEATGKAVETLLGARLEINANKVLDDYGFRLGGRGPAFAINIMWAGGEPVMTGGYMGGGMNGNHLELNLGTPERVKQDRARLEQLLAAGTPVESRADADRPPGQPARLDLKIEPLTGKVVGKATYAKNKRGVEATCDVTGEVQEKGGLVLLDLSLQAMNPPTGYGFGPMRLWVLPDKKGLLLSGYVDPEGRNPRYPAPMSYRVEGK